MEKFLQALKEKYESAKHAVGLGDGLSELLFKSQGKDPSNPETTTKIVSKLPANMELEWQNGKHDLSKDENLRDQHSDTKIIEKASIEAKKTGAYVWDLIPQGLEKIKNLPYEGKGTGLEIKKGMEALGQQVIDQAKKDGIALTDIPELQGADFDKNGKIDAKEIGALLLAAASNTGKGEYIGEVKVQFDNTISQRDLERLQDPEVAKAIKEVAKQILQDNGVKVADSQTDAQFVQSVGQAPGVTLRC